MANLKNREIRQAIRNLITSPTGFIFARIALTLGVEESKHKHFAATDGRKIYIGEEFENIDMIIAHEAMHIIQDVFQRVGDRDIFLWNLATDYAINGLLHKCAFTLEKGCMYDPQFDNMSSEQIYRELLDAAKSNSNRKFQTFGGGTIRFGEDEGAASQEVANNPCKTDASKFTEGMTDEEKAEVKKSVCDAIASASSDNATKRLLQDFIIEKKPFDWRRLLRKKLDISIKKKPTIMRPNKRNDLIRGKRRDKEIKRVGIYIDTSGSISFDQIKEVIGYIATLPCEAKIKTFSDEIADTHFNLKERKDLKGLQEHVRKAYSGGTCIFKVPADAVKERFNACVMFTDGYDSGDGTDSAKFKRGIVAFVNGDEQFAKKWATKVTVVPFGKKGDL